MLTTTVIQQLVESFYDAVQHDDLLGPLFANHVDDWDRHHSTMCKFWGTVMLNQASYRGDPHRAHSLLLGLSEAHFERWLELFQHAADTVLAPEESLRIMTKANRMRRALERTALGSSG